MLHAVSLPATTRPDVIAGLVLWALFLERANDIAITTLAPTNFSLLYTPEYVCIHYT